MGRMQFESSPASACKPYDCLVYIGRFQPFHNGHLETVRRALELADKVVVLVGSANRSRSSKNPWTFEERRDMIRVALPEQVQGRVEIRPLPDVLYDMDEWVANVKANARAAAPEASRIGLIGHYKDDSSWYLKCFPGWALVEQPNYQGLNSTDVRAEMFYPSGLPDVRLQLPVDTLAWLKRWRENKPDVWSWVQAETKGIRDYLLAWAPAPYKPTFVTVDILVVHQEHMLVIRRGGFPGKGLLALPGGFLDQSECLEAAALRELQEETRMEVAPGILKKCIRGNKVFDHPDRSTRGRTITHAYLADISSLSRPVVTAGDDAREAFWMPIEDFLENSVAIYEDHWFIVSKLLQTRKSILGRVFSFFRRVFG